MAGQDDRVPSMASARVAVAAAAAVVVAGVTPETYVDGVPHEES